MTPTDLNPAAQSLQIAEARRVLEADGYVVLREKSHRQAQERQRVAEALMVAAEEAAESARVWARNCLAEERRLRDRITHVYGVARAHGATLVELAGPDTPPGVLASMEQCDAATVTVVVDPVFLMFAFRYALGSMTYAVGIVADALIANVERLRSDWRQQVIRDVEAALAEHRGGMTMDADRWRRVAEVMAAAELAASRRSTR